MNESQYHSTIKVEFKELIKNFITSKRESFHLYTIHRLLSLGLLLDFPFQYLKIDSYDDGVGIELDLKEDGKVLFILDLETNYVKIKDERGEEVLTKFFENFDTSYYIEGGKMDNVF